MFALFAGLTVLIPFVAVVIVIASEMQAIYKQRHARVRRPNVRFVVFKNVIKITELRPCNLRRVVCICRIYLIVLLYKERTTMGNLLDEICIRCNENKVTMLELYCLNCYVELNSEIDYTEIDKLWTTQEAY